MVSLTHRFIFPCIWFAVALKLNDVFDMFNKKKIRLFYMDNITKPIACFQDDPWVYPHSFIQHCVLNPIQRENKE